MNLTDFGTLLASNAGLICFAWIGTVIMVQLSKAGILK